MAVIDLPVTPTTESTTCLFCGVNDERPLLARPEPRHVVCRRCGFVYQNPRPTPAEMRRHYQQQYWERRGITPSDSAEDATASNPRVAGIVGFLQGRVKRDDLVLEIGCGHAEILAGIRDEFGCHVLGIEPSEAQADAARKRFGIEIQCSDLETMNLSGRTPRGFVLSHVLEHIYEPLAALKRICELLGDDAWLLIEVPNILRPHRKKRLSNWLAREHVYYFSRISLTRLLEMAGFRAIEVKEKEYLRVLAQKWPASKRPMSAKVNEYWRVRRAIAIHEALYWPWRLLRRIGVPPRAA